MDSSATDLAVLPSAELGGDELGLAVESLLQVVPSDDAVIAGAAAGPDFASSETDGSAYLVVSEDVTTSMPATVEMTILVDESVVDPDSHQESTTFPAGTLDSTASDVETAPALAGPMLLSVAFDDQATDDASASAESIENSDSAARMPAEAMSLDEGSFDGDISFDILPLPADEGSYVGEWSGLVKEDSGEGAVDILPLPIDEAIYVDEWDGWGDDSGEWVYVDDGQDLIYPDDSSTYADDGSYVGEGEEWYVEEWDTGYLDEGSDEVYADETVWIDLSEWEEWGADGGYVEEGDAIDVVYETEIIVCWVEPDTGVVSGAAAADLFFA